jgi:formylmethanofuran dehydrogenase subunit B
VIPCDVSRLDEAFALLRAQLAGRALQAQAAAGVPATVWQSLADRMKSARYGVMAWAARDFDFPHAELTIQTMCELIKDLNQETRFSGLPLAGSDGDLTSDTVHLWQTGFGSRTAFGQGVPAFDVYHHATARLLASGEADALLWIASLNETRGPPQTSIPVVVLGRADLALDREPTVFIPVGIPGIDHAGHLIRADRVVALPLRQLRPAALPSVADAIMAIEVALDEA